MVVARWEFREYHFTFHGDPYRDNGNVLRISEAVTDKSGAFVISGWGPKLTLASGRLDDHNDPKLLFFSYRYMPLELSNNWVDHMNHNPATERTSQWNGKTIRLKKFSGSCAEYAQALREFQGSHGRGLLWSHQGEGWKAMPRMVEALARAKHDLGQDGAQIEGVANMFGRSGKGSVIDSATGKPFPHYVVISVTWKIRPTGDQIAERHTMKFLMDQGTARPESFSISAWEYPLPTVPPGWELDRSRPPVLRVYDSEAKYRRLSDVLWPESGQVLKMRPLSDTPEARAQELKLWRKELDEAFKVVSDTDNLQGYASQRELLKVFQWNCKKLPADLQSRLCYEPGSRQARLLQATYALSGKSYTYPERPGKAAACTTPNTALQN
jgi:hypothetical protein